MGGQHRPRDSGQRVNCVPLLRLGILLRGREVEEKVGLDHHLAGLMEEGDVLVLEAREVLSADFVFEAIGCSFGILAVYYTITVSHRLWIDGRQVLLTASPCYFF